MKRLFLRYYKGIVATRLFLIFAILYWFTNNYHIRKPIDFGSFFKEDWIPFLAWTPLGILYISLYAQMVYVIWKIPKHTFREITVLIGHLLLIHLVLYIVCPITYGRICYPTDNWLIAIIRNCDNPGNCTPSIHVSFAIYFCYLYCKIVAKNIGMKIVMWVWSLGIILSTLFLKQHYLFDVGTSIVATSVIIFMTPGAIRPKVRIAGITDFTYREFVRYMITPWRKKL